jgi:Tfp pilus assembly protein PilX
MNAPRTPAKRSERGAALLAVLAMVVLLAGFATVGLERLKAAGNRITEAEARTEAQLLASAPACRLVAKQFSGRDGGRSSYPLQVIRHRLP